MTTEEHAETAPMPTERSRATLPKWFCALFYATFAPFCIFSSIWIAHSMSVQRSLTASLALLCGAVGREPSSEQVEQARRTLKGRPNKSFQYLLQALLQEELHDGRMARAMALRKALQWGKVTKRRDLINRIVAGMTEKGQLTGDFEMSPEAINILDEMIAEREARSGVSYAEQLVTDVLKWLASGRQEPPQGPEKRRMQALQKEYEKKTFVGPEAGALDDLIVEWAGSTDEAAKAAAGKFSDMLQGVATGLSEAEAAYCEQQAAELERAYERGMTRVAEAALAVARVIASPQGKPVFVDHPHIYQYASLLGYRFHPDHPDRFEGARQAVAEGVWVMRRNKFVVRFLSWFASRTAINPVMAVETVTLTKEEHERQMIRENNERVHRAIRMLERIFKDYVAAPDDYEFDMEAADKRDDYVRSFIVHPFEALAEHFTFGRTAEASLEAMRRTPGAERFFAPTR